MWWFDAGDTGLQGIQGIEGIEGPQGIQDIQGPSGGTNTGTQFTNTDDNIRSPAIYLSSTPTSDSAN